MSLKKQIFGGVKWTTLSTVILVITGLLKISILARFLEPEDFGLIALVTFVLGFMNLFTDMGLTTAILHKQNISREEYSSLYWINIIISVTLFGVIFLISPFISSFYQEPELSTLIRLMGISVIFSAIGTQFKTIAHKNLDFKYLSLVEISGAIIGLFISIILAIYNFGVYSIVYGTLAQNFLINLIFFLKGINKYPIYFYFMYEKVKPFLQIGVFQVGGQMMNYFNRDLDVLIIGKFLGTEILGGYSLAKQLVNKPLIILNPILIKIGSSVLPKFQSDNNKLRAYFLKIFSGFGSLVAFIYGIIAIFAFPIVLIFYGEEYIGIVVIVQILTCLSYLRSMGGISGLLVVTKGRTDIEFYWNFFRTLFLPAIIYFGAQYSIYHIIILLIIAQIIFSFPSWLLFYRNLIRMKFSPYFFRIIIPLAISIFFVGISFNFFGQKVLGQISCAILMAVSIFSYLLLMEDDIKRLPLLNNLFRR